MPGLGIESLQKMGTKFLMCANALGGWCMELEARGKGKAPELEKELRANLLPGVTIVPAMVIAIEQAQAPASSTTVSNAIASETSIRVGRMPANRLGTSGESGTG